MGDGIATGLLLAFPIGAVMGSFAAALAWRLPRGENWISGRSCCTTCGAILSYRDLIPLLSWFFLRGRCRYCGEKIPIRYPVIELLTACAFSFPVLLNGGFWLDLLFLWVLATGLMVLALVDLRHHYIPDGATAVVAVTGVTASLTGFSVPFSDAFTACLLLGAGTGLVRFLTSRIKGKETLGLGDVKLFAAAGLWVGVEGIGPLLLGSAMVGLLFHLISNSRRAAPEMPFGPCIACTLYTLCIWG